MPSGDGDDPAVVVVTAWAPSVAAWAAPLQPVPEILRVIVAAGLDVLAGAQVG